MGGGASGIVGRLLASGGMVLGGVERGGEVLVGVGIWEVASEGIRCGGRLDEVGGWFDKEGGEVGEDEVGDLFCEGGIRSVKLREGVGTMR
ncbi:hypothetical protein NE237_016360 [Protea cynaroides]|uniref:Uncharacterized protein n=1 Tax=Protea cynaroides TaxID=273540 RepID=A0A9Q0GLS0_9MAGN|nr:hypothetical protein NE237_016360 [Protea cynaroides]